MAMSGRAIKNKVISERPVKKKPRNDNSILINDADEILALLKKLFKKHSLLTINFSEIDDYFGSTILEINEEDNYLVLDELHPIEGHEHVDEGTKFRINTQYSGALVRFSGTVEAISSNPTAAYYKIPIPRKIDYQQRRSSFRVHVGINETIPVQLVTEDDVMLNAELRDISLGGVSLRVNDVPHVSLEYGDHIPTCMIKVTDERKIRASLNVCHVVRKRDIGILRIGAQFAEMSNYDQRELEHLVAEMEREMIKKIKRVNS